MENHVIKAQYQGLYRLLCTTAGENPDICKIPTFALKVNVKGSVIYAAFNIPGNQKLQYTPLGPDKLNTLLAQYAQVECVLTNEFSMIGNKMLTFMNITSTRDEI